MVSGVRFQMSAFGPKGLLVAVKTEGWSISKRFKALVIDVVV